MAKTVTKKKANLKKNGSAEKQSPVDRLRSLDEATWTRIETYAEQAERDIDDVVAEIMETAEEDYLQQYSEEQRPIWAMRIVASRITVEGLTSADAYQFLVLDVAPPKVIKTRNGPKTIANVYGIAAKYGEDGETGDPSFGEVAFWDEDADRSVDAKIGTAYDVKLGGNFKDGRFQLRGGPKTKWNNEIELEAEALDVLRDLYQVLDLADLEDHVASPGKKQPVLINGNVTFARSNKSAQGNAYGLITVWDESQEQDDRGVSVFCSPHQVQFGTGSSLWILGTVSPGKKNQDTGEQYAPSINALAIIPELIVPPSTPQTTQTRVEEADSIDDDEEAVDFGEFNASADSEEEE